MYSKQSEVDDKWKDDQCEYTRCKVQEYFFLWNRSVTGMKGERKCIIDGIVIPNQVHGEDPSGATNLGVWTVPRVQQ